MADPHLAVLTTHACLMQGHWLWTDKLDVIQAWWQLIHNQINQWDFAEIFSKAGGAPMMGNHIIDFLHECIGYSA